MIRNAMLAIASAIAALGIAGVALAQAPSADAVALDRLSAGRALDAVPAVLAVAQNVEGFKIEVSPKSISGAFINLADQDVASDQLTGALGAYGFEGYRDWAATIRTIFATYRFLRSQAPDAPAVTQALAKVLDDPDIPDNQKESIAVRLAAVEADPTGSGAGVPSQDNLSVVISLLPHIESTIQTVRALQ